MTRYSGAERQRHLPDAMRASLERLGCRPDRLAPALLRDELKRSNGAMAADIRNACSAAVIDRLPARIGGVNAPPSVHLLSAMLNARDFMEAVA